MQLSTSQTRYYGIMVPLSQWESVSCEVAGCRAFQNGWRTSLLEGDNGFGDESAYKIRHSKYKFTEERREDGVTVFTFAPGQNCFRGLAGEHKRRKPDAKEIYLRRDGHGDPYRHTNASSWVDDFANHQGALASAFERG